MNNKNTIIGDEIKLVLKELNKYSFIIGIVDSEERKSPKNKQGNKSKEELTNAELLRIHENGSSIRKIPPRPILRYTIEESSDLVNKAISKAIDMILDGRYLADVEEYLEKIAVKIENICKVNVMNRKWKLIPNSELTKIKKNSDAPLIDTGQMVQNIRCILRKN